MKNAQNARRNIYITSGAIFVTAILFFVGLLRVEDLYTQEFLREQSIVSFVYLPIMLLALWYFKESKVYLNIITLVTSGVFAYILTPVIFLTEVTIVDFISAQSWLFIIFYTILFFQMLHMLRVSNAVPSESIFTNMAVIKHSIFAIVFIIVCLVLSSSAETYKMLFFVFALGVGPIVLIVVLGMLGVQVVVVVSQMYAYVKINKRPDMIYVVITFCVTQLIPSATALPYFLEYEIMPLQLVVFNIIEITIPAILLILYFRKLNSNVIPTTTVQVDNVLIEQSENTNEK